MTAGIACVDTSLVLMVLLPDENRSQAERLFSGWAAENAVLVCPPLLYAEVPSVLREAVYFGRLSVEEDERAFEIFCDLDIVVSRPADLHILAWQLAKQHRQPRIYDSMYLAVARSEGCDL